MVERVLDSVDDPADRPGARSLAAGERPPNGKPQPAQRAILPWVLTTGAIAFALGMIANPWFEASVRSRLPVQFQHPPSMADTERAGRLDALAGRLEKLETGPVAAEAPQSAVPDDLVQRIVGIEAESARLAAADAGIASRLDQLVATAASSAAGQGQMRDLFVLSAARRFVEVGRSFGVYEGILTQRFSALDRTATEALAAWSAAPQSRDMLLERLQEPIETAPTALPPGSGWWDRLVARLSDVVQVRSEDALAADPETRQKAQDALASGDLSRAIATFELLPASRTRDLWLADARRLQAAEQALAALETLLLAAPLSQPVGPVGPSVVPPLDSSGAAAPVAAANPAVAGN